MRAQDNPPDNKAPYGNASEARCKLTSGLYFVATPIGNLRDISLRALDVLQGADAIYCEDTRVSARLAQAYGLRAPLISCHEHNQQGRIPEILAGLQAGKVLAYISDAGMPLISDPGAPLVAAVQAAGLPMTVIPGANAALSALSLSGLSAERFCFIGFLPTRAGARRQELGTLAAIPASLIFYESPNRLAEALADMLAVLGNRPAAVARELTKLHEEVRRGMLQELAAHYAAHEVRGEVVVVLGPPEAQEETFDLDALLQAALTQGSARDAAAVVAARTGLPKREVYARAIALTRDKP